MEDEGNLVATENPSAKPQENVNQNLSNKLFRKPSDFAFIFACVCLRLGPLSGNLSSSSVCVCLRSSALAKCLFSQLRWLRGKKRKSQVVRGVRAVC